MIVHGPVTQRARAQTIVFAAIAMVAIVGAVGLVVDFGVFFVIQRQMQTAANAAALAAVWYPPVCFQAAADCQDPLSISVLKPECTTASHLTDGDGVPCTVAHEFADANLGPAQALCHGPLDPGQLTGVEHMTVLPQTSGKAADPNVNVYAVTIECDAQHWFGRILPQSPSCVFCNHISVNGAATIGWLGQNGDLSSVPLAPRTLIARLVDLHS